MISSFIEGQENHHLHEIFLSSLCSKFLEMTWSIVERRRGVNSSYCQSHVGATLRKDRGCAHPACLPPHLKSLLLVISLFPSCREAFVPCLFSHSPLNMKILPEKGPEKGWWSWSILRCRWVRWSTPSLCLTPFARLSEIPWHTSISIHSSDRVLHCSWIEWRGQSWGTGRWSDLRSAEVPNI